MHRHGAIRVVCETYGAQVLGIRPTDRCLSAAKAFFAYGLGNSVLFPLSVGATTILEPSPSRPQVVADRAREYGATLFFAARRSSRTCCTPNCPPTRWRGVRLSASAGEPLPEALYRRWTGHFGIDILDGIGMTEMLHIFLSNREGSVHAGTTGVAVPGYDLRILDEDGHEATPGTPGTLYVRGDSTAIGYWSRYDATRHVFQGEWLCTGDTYVQDADGYYACLGRTGDMIKASGMWVAPAEVETRLLQHPAVGQAAVVATVDSDGLEKPVAYVVLATGAGAERRRIGARIARSGSNQDSISARSRDHRVLPCGPALVQATAAGNRPRRAADDRDRQGPPRRAAVAAVGLWEGRRERRRARPSHHRRGAGRPLRRVLRRIQGPDNGRRRLAAGTRRADHGDVSGEADLRRRRIPRDQGAATW